MYLYINKFAVICVIYSVVYVWKQNITKKGQPFYDVKYGMIYVPCLKKLLKYGKLRTLP